MRQVDNRDVARIFEKIAALLEIEEGNPFRIRSFQRAAQVIEDLPFSIEKVLREDPDLLRATPGIGEGTLARIREIVETGSCDELDRLTREIPAGLLEMLGIRSIGPRRITLFWKRLGITSLDELEEAARQLRLRDLPGMGARSEAKILESIEFLRRAKGRFRLDEGLRAARSLVDHLKSRSSIQRVSPAGSLRRRRETVGDIDILVSCHSPDEVSAAFTQHPEVEEISAQGPTKTSVRLKSGLACDLRVLEDESFGAALQYFTGSRAHNIALRERAKRIGLKISEYGVFTIEGNRKVAGSDEADVYRLLGLADIPPELRENRGELEAAERALPDLIEREDIRGELHTHTTASDGNDTLHDMVTAARELGYEYVAITDHSKSLAITGGLDEERLLEQLEEIDCLNKSKPGIRVLRGIEVDILPDGRLDLPGELLVRLDVVIASVHSGFNMSSRDMTRRICKALENPVVNILGHPTGRLILHREGYPLDLGTVMRTARENRVCLEINAHPKRLDLNDINCRMARDMGVLISINTDSHDCAAFGMIEYGVYTARRGWLEARDVINTYPLIPLMKTLGKQ